MEYRMMRFDDATIEKVITSWQSLIKQVEDDDLARKLEVFLNDNADQFFTVPASPSVNYAAAHNCMPGGLAEHTLRVYRNFHKLVHEHMDMFDHPVSEDDILVAAMFHDMGKMGDTHNPYYLEQDSDWHRRRGMFYQMNPDIDYMRVQHRSLYLMQLYGIKAPLHVFKAVMLHDGMHDESNKHYSMKEGLFAQLLAHADVMAAVWEQKRYNDWLSGLE